MPPPRRRATLPPGQTEEPPPQRRRSLSLGSPELEPRRNSDIVDPLVGVTVAVPHAVLQYGRTELVVVYALEVSWANGEKTTRLHRFSEFEQMHSTLPGTGKFVGLLAATAGLPALPSRSAFFAAATNTSFKAIDRRRHELQTYIRRLCAVSHGTPLAAVVARFLDPHAPKNGAESAALHQGHTVVRTHWHIECPDTTTPLRIELPWARQNSSSPSGTGIVVDAVKGEGKGTVRRRFQEFQAFLGWVVSQGDRVPSCRDSLCFLAAWRKSSLSGVTAKMAAPKAGTPPTHIYMRDSSVPRRPAIPESAPVRSELFQHYVSLPQVVVTPPAEDRHTGRNSGISRLSNLSVAELRKVAATRGIDLNRCVEKADIVARLASADQVILPRRLPITPPASPASEKLKYSGLREDGEMSVPIPIQVEGRRH
eukprot:Hpha_TRINITY_DN8766_c0_g1::TRINITY_DN8766_c0_g1_i1::g.45271::m.45271